MTNIVKKFKGIKDSYGEWEGYLYIIERKSETRSTLNMYINNPQHINLKNQIAERFSESNANFDPRVISYIDYHLSVELFSSVKAEQNDVKYALDKVTRVLKENKCDTVCSMSHNTGDIGVYRVGSRLYIINDYSFEKLVEKGLDEDLDKKQDVKKGLIGAAVGGLIGLSIQLIASMFVKYETVTWLSMFNVILIFVGYEFKGGRMSKPMGISLVLISVFWTHFCTYICYFVSNMMRYSDQMDYFFQTLMLSLFYEFELFDLLTITWMWVVVALAVGLLLLIRVFKHVNLHETAEQLI